MNSSNDIRPLQSEMWAAIHEVSHLIEKCEDPIFGEIGVSVQQCTVLITLVRSERPPTITALAERLHRNVNSMSAIIDRMVRNDLVKRTKDVSGGRASYVVMTPTGKRIAELAAEQESKLIERLLGHAQPKELRACLSMVEGVIAELTRMSDKRRSKMAGIAAQKE